MDLKAEILAVLDNPARVWDAVLTNLATEPRISLLVLATCKTPISLVEWQEALARVSTEAAVKFESSLRVLDDSFISTERVNNTHRARFRNPSMDDFCASYLDRNVGIATTVASHEPALYQVSRLIELGTALEPIGNAYPGFRERRFSSIYEALISDPSVLLLRLLEILPDDTRMSDTVSNPALIILTLLSQAKNVPDKMLSATRARLMPTILALSFDSGSDHFLFSALDDRSRASALANLFGNDFEILYGQLAASAETLAHFDTLVNLDIALQRSGTNADWAERFGNLTSGWLDEEGSAEDISSSRYTYIKVAEHLEMDDTIRLQEWDEKIEAAEAAESEDEVQDDDSSSWSGGSEKTETSKNNEVERQQVDAMFASLRDSHR